MHPEPNAQGAAPTTPAPTDSSSALAAHLDEVMAQTAIAANAQRDEEAGVPLQGEPPRQEAPGTTADSEGEDTEDDEEEDEASPAEQPAPEAAPAASEAPTEPPKYSRRDAARFAQERDTAQREATEVRTIAERAQAEVNAMRAADQQILSAMSEVSGYTRDANGRFRYENLRDKVVEGTASEQERQEVAEMTQWHKLAGPIYRAAEAQVTQAFSADWAKLKDLEGVGDAGLQKLNQAPNGVAAAREIHTLAYAAGEAKANAAAKATIARLQSEVKSLKNGKVANLPQPAVTNGAAVATNGSWREKAFNPDGSLNDDFDKEVRAGKWLGVDLSQS